MRACFNANKNPQARPEAQSRRHGLRAFLSAKSPGPGRKGGGRILPQKKRPHFASARKKTRAAEGVALRPGGVKRSAIGSGRRRLLGARGRRSPAPRGLTRSACPWAATCGPKPSPKRRAAWPAAWAWIRAPGDLSALSRKTGSPPLIAGAPNGSDAAGEGGRRKKTGKKGERPIGRWAAERSIEFKAG